MEVFRDLALDKTALIGLHNYWYSKIPLTPEQETALRKAFGSHPLGQTNFKIWYKQRVRQLFENHVRESQK